MSIITQQDSDSLKEFIQIHNNFIIIGHKEPDGDCIAACLGLASILDYYKKPYQLISAGPFKRQEIKKYESKFTDKIEFMDSEERNHTGLLITDCSEISRLGDIDFLRKSFYIDTVMRAFPVRNILFDSKKIVFYILIDRESIRAIIITYVFFESI